LRVLALKLEFCEAYRSGSGWQKSPHDYIGAAKLVSNLPRIHRLTTNDRCAKFR
jgi:hypothetical protein